MNYIIYNVRMMYIYIPLIVQNKDEGFVSVFRRSSEVQNNVGRSMKDINSIVSANKIWPLTLPQKDTCIFHLSL